MTLLLDLLDPSESNSSDVQCAALLTLVTALLGSPRNARCFERVGGLEMVTSLLRPAGSITAKQRSRGGSSGRSQHEAASAAVEVSKEVRLKVLEFLYFYLMPETASDNDDFWSSGRSESKEGRGSGKSTASAESKAGSGKSNKSLDGEHDTRTSREKQKLLGRYLNNVDDLVQDLRESAPFGEVAAY